MHQWILYDYYMRENETEDVLDLICSLLKIDPKYKKVLFEQNKQEDYQLNRKNK